MKFNNYPVKTKLFFLISIISILLVIFTFLFIKELSEEKNTYKEINNSIKLSGDFGELIHSLQKERGYTAGFLSSKGAKFADDLSQQRKETNSIAKSIEANYSHITIENNEHKKIIEKSFNNLHFLIQNRSTIDNFSINAKEAILAYTNTIALMVDLPEALVISSAIDSELFSELSAYLGILKYKENFGQIRATLNAVFVKQNIDIDSYNRFSKLINNSELFISQFRDNANEQLSIEYDKITKSQTGTKVSEITQFVLTHPNYQGFYIEPTAWFEEVTSYINDLRIIEKKSVEQVNEISNKLYEKTNYKFWLLTLISISLIFGSFSIFYWVVNNIINNLKIATQSILNLASGKFS